MGQGRATRRVWPQGNSPRPRCLRSWEACAGTSTSVPWDRVTPLPSASYTSALVTVQWGCDSEMIRISKKPNPSPAGHYGPASVGTHAPQRPAQGATPPSQVSTRASWSVSPSCYCSPEAECGQAQESPLPELTMKKIQAGTSMAMAAALV